jgi:hypothetical protein
VVQRECAAPPLGPLRSASGFDLPATEHEVGIREHPVGPVGRLRPHPAISRDQLAESGGGRPPACWKKGVKLRRGGSKCRFTDGLHHCASSTTVAAVQRFDCCILSGILVSNSMQGLGPQQ